jgi:hypothetical protein
MAYTSGSENPMPDVYTDGYSLTNEILSTSLETSKASHGPNFSFTGPHVAVSNADVEVDMESILSIFQLEEDTAEYNGGDEMTKNDIDHVVDINDQNRRTERLKGICSALDRLWWSGSDFMAAATEKLADGSRDRK